jgi:proteasome accessory factor A
VPEAALVLKHWSDTLDLLERRDFDVLARRLDWVLKRRILERAMDAGRDLDWHSPEIAYLDQIYGSLDENEGLYWACEREGAVDRVVGDAEVHLFTHEPPLDTRAWTRAMLLRAHADSDIEEVDWSYVRLSPRASGHGDDAYTIWLPAPDLCGRPEHGLAPIVHRNANENGGTNGAT